MLRLLDLPGGPVIVTFDELADEWPPGEGERFRRLGLLREIEPARQILLTECEREPLAEPIWRTNPMTGKLEGVYGCGDDECAGIHYIDPQRMRQWEFGFDALASAVASAIGAAGGVTVELRNVCAFLGTVTGKGQTRDVFLTRGSWWKDTPAVLAPGTRFASSNNATVLCAHRMPPVERRLPSWRAVVSLEEIASMGDGGLTVPAERVLEDQPPAAATTHVISEATTPALTQQDIDVLAALGERPEQALSLVELMAAAGYSKHAVRAALDRLGRAGLVARPPGTARKGWSLSQRGKAALRFCQEPASARSS
ncbi:MarR family transcriptional regulator [Fontivita pretiosa]|uniref:MarR family transcriptional regulator n=1 Tax=Fontivita pretiosa TaxID=2989684 RepID=UPI003D177874